MASMPPEIPTAAPTDKDAAQSSPGKLDHDNRKRKRNTIACFQCRARKRRCDVAYTENCENCVRDRLECRRPEMDGRKTRWQKGKMRSNTNSNIATGQNDSSNSREFANSVQENLGGPSTGCLFDMLIGSTLSGVESNMPATDLNGSSETQEIANGRAMLPQNDWTRAGSGLQPHTLSTETGSDFLRQYQYSGNNLPSDLWDSRSPNNSTLQHSPQLPGQLARNISSPGSAAQSPLVKKVVWWRSHGPSAIAPGLKRITLKVRLDHKEDSPVATVPPPHLERRSSSHGTQERIVDEGGMPRYDLMVHLLDTFMTHFGCQYPALSRAQLDKDLEQRSGSTLLFNCIASTASRFSKHPDIALPDLQPHSYGLPFLKAAKNMLGNMLAVPTRETVIALVLLAGISHGIDSESEEWMAAGMAVRMAIDLGLHLAPPPDAVISEEDRRLDRLTFWSVYFLDVSLSFGVGRETAFRLAAITQTIPAESDFTPPEETGGNGGSTSMLPVRSAFSYAARLAFAYGPLVNVLNGPWQNRSEWESQAQRITQQAVEVYNDLPPDMQWSAYNLQNLSQANQGSIFVQMHLWMHTILASGYLIGTDVVRPDRKSYTYGTVTPSNTTATRLWQNSARTIGDILILSDIVNPFVYHALPFSNQPFVVAGCCYIKEADAQRQRQMADLNSGVWDNFDQSLFSTSESRDDLQPTNVAGDSANDHGGMNSKEERAEMFRTLLQSVTSNNITALRQGLVRQTRYWAGVAWVAEVLAQRMAGISMDDIDLKTVTEGLDSTVAISDARMFRQSNDASTAEEQQPFAAQPFDPSSAWFDTHLPLEADWLADTALLQSQGYPVVVEDFVSNWTRDYM